MDLFRGSLYREHVSSLSSGAVFDDMMNYQDIGNKIPRHSHYIDPVMTSYEAIVDTILAVCPDTQAVYRYGSWGTPHQRADSDLDVAVLLPHDLAMDVDPWQWATLNGEIAHVTRVDRVDLVNLRDVDTTLQAEIRIRAWFVLAMNYGDGEPEEYFREFQDTIFNQDKAVLESQRPKCLPLDPNAELHHLGWGNVFNRQLHRYDRLSDWQRYFRK